MPKLNESLLSQLDPFKGLERAQIRSILDMATTHRFDTGEAVFHEGADANRFYCLLDGYIRVVRVTAEGEHVTVTHIPAGQLFGIAQALGHTHFPATAFAASEAIVLSWPQRQWPSFSSNYPGFSVAAYRTIGERMREMHDQVVEMATQQVEQRVANALLRLITQMGRRNENGIEVDFPITRQDLSEMTGTTLHTVSRLLSAWEKRGIVESRRKHILVRNPHQLVILAEPSAKH
ncbi:Crp/Fnr family transcriptional regulator [Roseovarius dicentrarchi]|uniref:Crp/Fnr family transcriptional regulator n=1 Tax=Roseovarius dicentrarchi TaxID=2250573 RepID=UPI000DE81D1A|nr:Crp/Fnr family transcriptional regulator [Roseovarius dicentrarchi]